MFFASREVACSMPLAFAGLFVLSMHPFFFFSFFVVVGPVLVFWSGCHDCLPSHFRLVPLVYNACCRVPLPSPLFPAAHASSAATRSLLCLLCVDLEQVLHALQMWSRKSSKMTYMNLKGGISAIEKDKVIDLSSKVSRVLVVVVLLR